MSKKLILIVEDEVRIAEVLIAYCHDAGFEVKHIERGSEVISFVQNSPVELILLDILLPEINGIKICKKIRESSDIPIIMISAKREDQDRLTGLEEGADDYICKPFNPREVIARIKAILKRVGGNKKRIIQWSDITMIPDEFTVQFKGIEMILTKIEFGILELLLNNVGKVYSRDMILSKVYQDSLDVSDRNIDTHVKNIRKKINKIAPGCNPIKSVYGVGYKLSDNDNQLSTFKREEKAL